MVRNTATLSGVNVAENTQVTVLFAAIGTVSIRVRAAKEVNGAFPAGVSLADKFLWLLPSR